MKTKTITVAISMSLAMDDESALTDDLMRQIATHTETQIRNRLFGSGFLPDDVCIDEYSIRATAQL